MLALALEDDDEELEELDFLESMFFVGILGTSFLVSILFKIEVMSSAAWELMITDNAAAKVRANFRVLFMGDFRFFRGIVIKISGMNLAQKAFYRAAVNAMNLCFVNIRHRV